jgi:O-antigen/teichoic acid export membrane protein
MCRSSVTAVAMINRLAAYLKGNGLGPTLVKALMGSAGIRLAGMGFGFLVGVQLARGLGAAGYGVYGIAMSTIAMVMIPTEFGLPQLVMRQVAAAQVKNDSLLIASILQWASRMVMLLSSMVVFIGLIGCLFFRASLSKQLASALLTGLFLVPLVPLSNLRGATLRGLRQIVRSQVPEIILRPALFSLLLLIGRAVLPGGLTPAVAMGMQVAAAALALAAAVWLLRRALPPLALRTTGPTASCRWFQSALPMALTEGMRAFQGNILIVLLGLLSTSATVGVFRVATSMGLLLMMPVSLIHVVSAPIFSGLHAKGDRASMQRMLTAVAASMVAGVTVLTLPFLFFGQRLLAFMFGAEFAGANSSLLILSAGVILGCCFGPGATLLNMTGHERRVTRAFTVALVALVVLAIPLVHFFGAEGAALANSFSFLLWSALMWGDARGLLRVETSLFLFTRRVSVPR